MLGTRTRGGRMEGTDESTELWRNPSEKSLSDVFPPPTTTSKTTTIATRRWKISFISFFLPRHCPPNERTNERPGRRHHQSHSTLYLQTNNNINLLPPRLTKYLYSKSVDLGAESVTWLARSFLLENISRFKENTSEPI